MVLAILAASVMVTPAPIRRRFRSRPISRLVTTSGILSRTVARQIPETFETRREAEAAAKAVRCGSSKPAAATAVDLGPYAGRKRYGVLVRCPGDSGLAEEMSMRKPRQTKFGRCRLEVIGGIAASYYGLATVRHLPVSSRGWRVAVALAERDAHRDKAASSVWLRCGGNSAEAMALLRCHPDTDCLPWTSNRSKKVLSGLRRNSVRKSRRKRRRTR